MSEINKFRAWFAGQQKRLAMTTEIGDLGRGRDWKFRGTHVGRADDAFHLGVLIHSHEPRGTVERFMLYPTPTESGGRIHGVVLLARHGEHFLVQAKAEPGNATEGCVILTATLQASHEHLSRSDIPFVNLFYDTGTRKLDVPQDGAMFYRKINMYCFLDMQKPPDAIPPEYRWAEMREILSLADEGLVGDHLLQALGILALSEV